MIIQIFSDSQNKKNSVIQIHHTCLALRGLAPVLHQVVEAVSEHRHGGLYLLHQRLHGEGVRCSAVWLENELQIAGQLGSFETFQMINFMKK